MCGFGGQTAINLVDSLNKAGVNIIGTNAEAIDITSDRGKFTRLLHDLGIPRIPGAAVYSKEEAINAAKIIGYPLVVRPSYVLGGRAMAIVNNHDEMEDYLNEAVAASEGHAI